MIIVKNLLECYSIEARLSIKRSYIKKEIFTESIYPMRGILMSDTEVYPYA